MGRRTIKPFPILHPGQTWVIWNEGKDDSVYVAVQEDGERPSYCKICAGCSPSEMKWLRSFRITSSKKSASEKPASPPIDDTHDSLPLYPLCRICCPSTYICMHFFSSCMHFLPLYSSLLERLLHCCLALVLCL